MAIDYFNDIVLHQTMQHFFVGSRINVSVRAEIGENQRALRFGQVFFPRVLEIKLGRHQHAIDGFIEIGHRGSRPLLCVEIIHQIGSHGLQQVRLAMGDLQNLLDHARLIIERPIRNGRGDELFRARVIEKAELDSFDIDEIIRPANGPALGHAMSAGEKKSEARLMLNIVSKLRQQIISDTLFFIVSV